MTFAEKEKLLSQFEEPDAANRIVLDLERGRHETGLLFSEEAVNQVLEMIALFIGGRVIGMYEATKREPDKVKITVTIENVEKHVTPGHHRLYKSN